MQKRQLDFSPVDGSRIHPSYDWTAERWRATIEGAWRFNPWTGARRNTLDVESDPIGLLIVPPGEDCRPFDVAAERNHRRVEGELNVLRARKAAEMSYVLGTKPFTATDVKVDVAAAREALHDAAEREQVQDLRNPSFPYKQNAPPAADPIEVQTFGPLKDTLDTTLADRGAKYGKFDRHAVVTQHLKRIMYTYKDRRELADDQVEALDMIAHKIGCILNGDPNYADSWIDIAGYAKLVADRLDGSAR